METSRVMVHFDDLLSVLNDAQLKSALNAYKEVRQLMKRASEQRKRKMGDRLTVGIRGKMSNLTDWINHRSDSLLILIRTAKVFLSMI